MHTKNLNQTIDYWIHLLDGYTLLQLKQQPASGGWSLGQLYLHLVNDTNFFIDQIKSCIHNNDHAEKQAHDFAKKLFQENTFPDISIQGNPSNAFIPQPQSKEQIKESLLAIKEQLNALATAIDTSFKGKSQHPGLGYFTAAEWLQFTDIHFRHHIKQQKRIELQLGLNQ